MQYGEITILGFLYCDGDRTMGNIKNHCRVPTMRRGEELRFTDPLSVDLGEITLQVHNKQL